MFLCSLSQSMRNLSNFKHVVENHPICNTTFTALQFPAHSVLLRVFAYSIFFCKFCVVMVSFKHTLMKICYESLYVYEWKRMLFSCSKAGMLAEVSWGNIIGSQHVDQIPEREERKYSVGAQHIVDPS